MEDDNTVVAEIRDSFGKGAARKIRAAGNIPAVVYGHGTQPQHITLPGHQVSLIVRKANALLNLEISGKNQLALVKDVQKDPVRQLIEHLDLMVVRRGERVEVEIPIHLEGETFSGTITDQDLHTLRLDVEATHIPDSIIVNVDGLEEGTHIYVKDVELPRGAKLVDEPDTLVLTVFTPRAAAVDEPAADDAGATAESAE